MKKIIRLNENDLTKLVKRVIKEQDENIRRNKDFESMVGQSINKFLTKFVELKKEYNNLMSGGDDSRISNKKMINKFLENNGLSEEDIHILHKILRQK